MPQCRLYGELAYLWPLISPPEDYADEAHYWRDALRAKLGHGRHRTLDLGVGGGHHLSHLTAEFQATAIDISKEMLQLSIKLNPGVDHHIGDMRSIRLGRRFKAVLAHDSISYMVTEADLRATFDTARAHLEPEGVFITAPEWLRETFNGPYVFHWTRRGHYGELTTIEYLHDPDPDDSAIESLFFYIFREKGRLRIEHDRHVTGLFSMNTWRCLMEEAGLVLEHLAYPADEAGFGGNLFVGTVR